MAKYEIMLLVDIDQEAKSKDKLEGILSTFSKEKNYKLTDLEVKDLAYKINKKTKAHYYLINFESNNSKKINDFHHELTLSNLIIRHLIINLDKDYGARAVNNSKKVELATKKKAKYDEIMEKVQKAKEQKEKAQKELVDLTSDNSNSEVTNE